jgi:apoptosis-inducing factor 2
MLLCHHILRRTYQTSLVTLSQIPCTGQCPNSRILEDVASDSISKETKHILVKPTLQISDESNAFPNIFALGDVAETGGPKMARACQAQAEVVLANILSIIKRRNPRTIYTPHSLIECAIKLTLGKVSFLFSSH